MNYITRQNILLRLTSPDTIFVLYAKNAPNQRGVFLAWLEVLTYATRSFRPCKL